MKTWQMRLRGAIGMGLAWAAAWFGAGILFLLYLGGAESPFPVAWAVFGFLAGTIFSGVLGVLEGGRTIRQLSLPGFMGWGALGGLLLAVLLIGVADVRYAVEEFLFFLPLGGAASAGGILMLARRSGRHTSHDMGRLRGKPDERDRIRSGGQPSPAATPPKD